MVGSMQRSLFAALILTLGLFSNLSYAGLINGDFSSGLDGWDHSDDVTVVGGRAVLDEDSGVDQLILQQQLSVTPSMYSLGFDLTFVSEGEGGGETDTFSVLLVDGADTVIASLYELNNQGGDPGIDVPSAVYRSVTLSNPIPDPLWLRFQADFEFLDHLTTVISVDNVTFTPSTPIPVPGAMSLLLAGLASLSVRRLRR